MTELRAAEWDKELQPMCCEQQSRSLLAAPPLCNALLLCSRAASSSLLTAPTFSQLLGKAVSQMKPVCAAYDRILAIERLHTLTAEQMSALTLTNHGRGRIEQEEIIHVLLA